MSELLGQEYTVLALDEGIYRIAQSIKFRNSAEFRSLVIRLGGFHRLLNFLGISGKSIRGSGIVESECYGLSTVDQLMNEKSYNRGIRCHKLLFEAFSRLKWDAFVKWMETSSSSLPHGLEDAILQAIKDCANLHQDYKVSGISSEVMQQLLENLVDSWSAILPYINEFNDIGRSHSETFLFWDTYLPMVELLLNYIAAERISNFSIHIKSFWQMLPWDFAVAYIVLRCLIYQITIQNFSPNVNLGIIR